MRTEMANGFANRFQFFCVRRSQFLAHGGNPGEAELAKLGNWTREAVEFARVMQRCLIVDGQNRNTAMAGPKLDLAQIQGGAS